MNDKILKGLEALKFLNISSIMDSTALKKEKVAACVLLADQISSLKPSMHSSPELASRTIEGLINLCDDNDADVRAAADESLNRVLRILSEWSVLSVQRELYAVIKKNASPRSVRTALMKFAALVGKTNPCKGRAFALHLIPCLVKLAARPEESVVETLGKALELIWPVLGKFANYPQTKDILKAFLTNLSSENTVIRRTSAASLVVIVSHSCKPEVFTSFTLNCVIEKVVPVDGDASTHLLQGVLNALRGLLPLLVKQINLSEDSSAYIDKQLQIYELCLHCAVNRDHNVVTAALETLNVLLSNPNRGLKNALLHPGGITRSYIHSVRQSSRLWSRTASEISVAGSVTTGEESLLDDSDLPFQSLVIPEQTSYTINRLRSLSASAEDDVDSDPESVISELGPPVSFVSRQGTKEEELNHEQEDLMSLIPLQFEKEMDVGSFTDAALSLLFCSRRLAALLLDGTPGGLRSDRSTRVSVKSIAVSCLSGVMNLCPRLLAVKLTPFSDCEQRICDVLLLSQHSDPQLRGVVCVLIGAFLNSSLMESNGRAVPTLDEFSKPMSIQNLLGIIHKCLRDSSPATSRLAITAVQIFLNSLIHSDYHDHAMSLLSMLPETAKNAYWLNKVRLIELLSSLDYVVIAEIVGNTEAQNTVLENVLFPMLRDIDGRVRRAAAEGIVNNVGKLCMKDSAHIAYSERFAKIIIENLKSGKKKYAHLHLSLPFWHLQNSEENNLIQPALSHIVAKLTHSLTVYADKYQLYGILEALELLTEKYPPIVYPSCWQCNRQANTGISCLLPFLVALVSSNSDVIDLACLETITELIANLYAGNAICAMKISNFEISSHVPNARWLIFGNDEMGKITEDFLTHVLTVLNIYTQLQEAPANTKPHGRILHLLPSKKGDREEVSYRVQPHYVKLHQTLRRGHSNYKMCIDDSASEKFLGVLSKTLLGLSAILEICLPTDSARIAEETLSYMRALIPLQQSPTLTVTLQLFRSLFGVNLPHYWTGLVESPPKSVDSLYANVFHDPEQLMCERSRKTAGGRFGKSEPKKQLCLNPDKMELVAYLKLLEHMIIKALRIYTKTPDIEFQCIVLTLLTQMVQENVKYSHLDEQLVFIGFVKKQLELVERGYIKGVDEILSKIFKFFVCLSSEKPNAKPLMTIPDILQLFVDLMASDLPHETHCVPGFMPVVVEVFTPRPQLGDERKETETQREVLLANLLRLAMHREILDALSYAVECDPQVSGKVAGTLLTLLADGRIKLEDSVCRKALNELFSDFSVSVFHPADCLLQTIFSEPRDQGEWFEMVRWLAAEAILLEALFQLKEDAILLRTQALVHPVDLSAFLSPPSTRPDPLMVSPPSLTFPPAESLARLILLSISRSAVVLLNNPMEGDQLETALNGYFVVIFHFLQSGNFHQTASALQNLIKKDHAIISSITDLFMQLSTKCPLLTSQYLNFIGLLLCVDPRLWTPSLTTTSSFAPKILQRGAILALADYLCENTWDVETMDLLFTATSEVLELYDEAPVKEVLTHGAQRPTSGPIILKAINALNLTTAKLTERALRVLRVIHADYSGSVVRLIIAKFLRLPYFALCRVASAQACRRLEYLLLQPHDQVLSQLPDDAFREMRSAVDETCVKHAALSNLVYKIGRQFYGLIEETKPSQQLIVSEINEEWFFNQVKQRCCQRTFSYREIGPLLIKLGYPYLKNLFSSPDFQIPVLCDCFLAVEVFARDSNGKVRLEDVPAYRAAREAIIERIGCSVFCEEADPIWDMARVLTVFLDTSPKDLSKEEMSAIVEFALHCLHQIAEGLGKNPSPSPSIVEAALSCTRALLNHRDSQIWLNLPEHRPILDTALLDCVSIVRVLVPDSATGENGVQFLVEFLLKPCSLPKYLAGILKRVAVLLCRLLPYWGAAVGVPDAGDVDPEVLHLLKDKIKILGWTNRAQFEEVWAAFLGGFSQDFGDSSTTCLAGMSALEGISVLMEETLLTKCGDPGSLLIGHSRDFSLLREYAYGAPRLNPDDGFFEDLEAVLQPGSYRVGLYSVEHLWSATQLAAVTPDAVASDSTTRQQIADIGLDLTSCLHFLLEVYSQWTAEIQDQQFLGTALKTSLILSDQFTDPSQFRSLLNIVTNIDKVFQPSHLPLLPFCILISAKCQAALLPGVNDYDRLKQMMTRSDAPSAKLATIQGLLFLVQSPVVYWKLQPTRQLGNSMFYVEDNEAVTQLVETFVPYAVELLLQFSLDRCSWSETYEIHTWTLLVYLLIHYRRELQDNRDEFIELLLSTLAAHKGSHATQTVILHGIERLMLAGSLDEEHLLKLKDTAKMLIGQPEPSARRNGYQILLTASFISKRCINPLVLDPDSLMEAMERLGLLLGRLRRAVPSEAAHAAHALRYLLRDFQPLDVLTKLIQEYLSPHHPYTNILGSLLFQVMEAADFELLQHWVVFSLPSLIHNVPIITSSRTLTCLFLSACRDPWLRAVFPLTQTRHHGKEVQFPQLLIEAAAHFYSRLEDTNKQEIFRNVFETASKTSPTYAEILNVITSK